MMHARVTLGLIVLAAFRQTLSEQHTSINITAEYHHYPNHTLDRTELTLLPIGTGRTSPD